MKRYITAAFTAILTTCISVAVSPLAADTTITLNGNSTVVVSENDHGISINIDDREPICIADYDRTTQFFTSQSTIKYQALTLMSSHNNRMKWEAVSGGLNIGLVNAVGQPADMGLRWAKSFEISWLNTLAVRFNYRSLSVSLGVGLDWRNYKMTGNNHYMVSPAPGEIQFAPAPAESRRLNSRIKVFSLGIPLLYTQHIPGTTLALTAGGIVNFNTHASLLSTYENSDNHRMEEYSEGIGKRNVTFDIYGAITFYSGNGLYIRYSPQSVLSGDKTPRFHPLSVGVTLFM